MQGLTVCENFLAVFQMAYESGTLRSVSDGSAPFHGSFGWKLVWIDGPLAHGGGSCQSFPGLTSHRMEASGRLGTDLFFSHVMKVTELPFYDGTITHICDNEECVDRSNAPQRRHLTTYDIHDMDIHMAIAALQTDIPARDSLWVKGHQDNNGDTSGLSDDAILNCEADRLADSFMQEHPPFLPPPPTVTLYQGKIPITWSTSRFLQELHGADKLRSKIMEKHTNWTATTFDAIAWGSYQSALKKLPDYQRTRIIKYTHRWSATGERQNKINNAEQDRCPNCPRPFGLPSPHTETENHIIRCSHPELTATRNKQFSTLDNTLTLLDTPPDVHTAITFGLKSWFNNDRSYGPEPVIRWPPPDFPYQAAHAPIQAAFIEQCTIGWDEFLRGRISTKWGHIMQDFYKSTDLGTNKTRNRLAWEVTVIKTTWNIFLSCWQKRNDIKYGANSSEHRQIQSLDVDQQIRHAYQHERNDVAPQHRGLFTNLNSTLTTTLNNKIAWLHSIRSAKSAWINLLHQADSTATDDGNKTVHP